MLADQPTLQSLLINVLKKHRNRTFCYIDGKATQYLKLDMVSNQVANAVRKLGYGPGDRIAVAMSNVLECPMAILGVMKSGATFSGLNPMMSEVDMGYILDDAQAKMVFIDAVALDKIVKLMPDRSSLKHVVVLGENVPKGFTAWSDFIDSASEDDPGPNARPDDEFNISYTGGTTGNPKGVVNSQSGYFFNLVAHCVDTPIQASDKMLLMTPLAHAAGLLMLAGTVKGSSFIVEKAFDPFKALELVEKEKVTTVFMVPTIIYMLLDILKQKKYDTSSLRLILYGAAPIAENRLAEALEVFGPIFFQKYGQVEIANMITTLTPEDHIRAMQYPKLLQSCGRPDSMTNVRIVDDNDVDVPPGSAGEIIVKAPYLMKGYLNQPELTANTLKGGWLHTGDMGRFDEEGYLYIVDRKKDMVVTGGMNVFSAEVEECIAKHPKVKQVAVIGIPDEKWGEAVTAIIVPNGDISSDEIIQFCQGKLSKYAVPKNVFFKDSLPMTLIGKTDKKVLRAPYWKDKDRMVH
jgi:fatty-acyl-CoA synthase/long-chain acyl-CoA synthetase